MRVTGRVRKMRSSTRALINQSFNQLCDVCYLQCTTNTVINTAYRSLYRNTTKQAILGPLCSAACTSLGEAITPWNIPMVRDLPTHSLVYGVTQV